jgi:hypothetical protein
MRMLICEVDEVVYKMKACTLAKKQETERALTLNTKRQWHTRKVCRDDSKCYFLRRIVMRMSELIRYDVCSSLLLYLKNNVHIANA